MKYSSVYQDSTPTRLSQKCLTRIVAEAPLRQVFVLTATFTSQNMPCAHPLVPTEQYTTLGTDLLVLCLRAD